jgi:predicted ABC-type ATPase
MTPLPHSTAVHTWAIPSSTRASVNRSLEKFIQDHIRDRISFAVETTVRSTIALEQAQQARDAGFYTTMSYIATADQKINLNRVAIRSEGGGHAASEKTLLSIRNKSFANMNVAIASVGTALDELTVYDNSINGKNMSRAFALNYSSRKSLSNRPRPYSTLSRTLFFSRC